MLLEEKVIVINGGTKGVGKELAFAAAKEGAKIVVAGRDSDAGMEIIESIKAGGREAHYVQADVRDVAQCENIFVQTKRKYGKIDGLFNYTGITPAASIIETEENVYDDVFSVNVKGTFFCTKYALKLMCENPTGGSIVFTGSTHAYGGEMDRAAYACSKGTILTMMKHIAKNYAYKKIRSNFITMGWVATPGEIAFRQSEGHDIKWLEKAGRDEVPLGRLLGEADFIPGLIYLLSDGSEMVTGTELHINGGANYVL